MKACAGVGVAGGDARRALGHRERVVVPLERRERRAPAEPFAARALVVDGDVDPADARRSGARATGAPSAFASSCPPRQCPSTGTWRATASRSRPVSGCDPRQAVVDAHRPPIIAMPEYARGSVGTGAPSSIATSFQRQRVAVEPLREIARALGRREAEDGDGKHGSRDAAIDAILRSCAYAARRPIGAPRVPDAGARSGNGASGRGCRRECGRSEPAGDPRVRGMVVNRLEVLGLDGVRRRCAGRCRAAPRRRAPCPRRTWDCCTRAR